MPPRLTSDLFAQDSFPISSHLRVEIFLDPVLAFLSPMSPSHERQSRMAFRFTLLACLTVLFTGTSVSGADAVPPAAFVFGDSLVDAGNNNYLVTLSRANYPPNGIDFDGHRSTGRYTNGRTIVDILGDTHVGFLPENLLSHCLCVYFNYEFRCFSARAGAGRVCAAVHGPEHHRRRPVQRRQLRVRRRRHPEPDWDHLRQYTYLTSRFLC